MFQGKVNNELWLVSDEGSGGILDLDDATMKVLASKHPPAAEIQPGALLPGPIPRPTPASYFDCIDEQQVLKAAQLTKGAGGPSQLDAEQYRHILASSKYKLEGKHLREQIALLGRKLASEIVEPSSLEALVACRLIPLDKCPCVRPIGVGEVLRRLIGKIAVCNIYEAGDWTAFVDYTKVPILSKHDVSTCIVDVKSISVKGAKRKLLLTDEGSGYKLKKSKLEDNVKPGFCKYGTMLIVCKDGIFI